MSGIKHRKEKDCLNCGHVVEENFCSRCGQENIVVKEKAWQMIVHAVADYFHFENKFFATLSPLLFKPGKLTTDYVNGKRISFIHPVRLYIFVSIIFFLVVLNIKIGKDKIEGVKHSIEANAKKTADSVSRVKFKSIARSTDGNEMSDAQIDSLITQLKEGKFTDLSLSKNNTKEADSTYEGYLARISKLPKKDQPGFFEKLFVKQQLKFQGGEQRKIFVDNLVHNIPKTMFILLPLFAMMLHLLYFRKKKYYYEDLIYSMHVHSGIFISFLIIKFFSWVTGYFTNLDNFLNIVLNLYILWYIYRSMRVFYGSSRWRTVANFFILLVVYFILMIFCLLLIAALTAISQ